jgi:alkanesulfonate monooxygenase SsuD/methylene tetrahydromethanopterin reductase-like flavin-dependent oxidoreductase (luciferase family)
VLIGQIAAATNTIRVGAAAVQLGHHTPLAVVESFGMLDAFYPGRIDLGVGRSGQRRREALKARSPRPRPMPEWREVDGVIVPPPFDIATMITDRIRAQSKALLGAPPACGGQPCALTPDFADQVADIEALFAGTFSVCGQPTRAVPGEGARLTPWIFGSSKGQSARVAGARGLPFVASYHITPGTALDAVAAYREAFTPSAHLSEPYVVVSADVVVADDTATARHLASTYGHWVYSVRGGEGAIPYPDPDHVGPLSDEQLALVKDRVATQFVGDPNEVTQRLDALQRVTGADELVVTSVTHGHADRLRSHELLAKHWGLG